MIVRQGTTRTVLLTDQWAIKLAWGLCRRPVRGWLANRSEWRQRHRPEVCRPVATLGHFVLVMPRAEIRLLDWLDDEEFLPAVPHEVPANFFDADGDETKPCSWGWFGQRWLLIDYDRSWALDDRGLVGRLYWANQERLGRKWSRLVDVRSGRASTACIPDASGSAEPDVGTIVHGDGP